HVGGGPVRPFGARGFAMREGEQGGAADPRPVATVQVGGRSVSIFPPPLALWEELNELQRLVGTGDAWPWVSRRHPVRGSPYFAPWHYHVLDAVVRHCTDGDFSGGLPRELADLVRAVLDAWDIRFANQAINHGLVTELLRRWEREMGLDQRGVT